MRAEIRISDRVISSDSAVFVVAEIGLNHNGDFNLAKKLILKAKECGADAVKFQTYKTENFVHPFYAKEQYEILKKYELSYEEVKKLKEFADKIGIIFFSSPFDFESVDFLYRINVPAFKIASSELSNILFVKYIASKKLPLLISTGLHNYSEIKKIINEINKINNKIVLLHCISEYPLKPEKANLNSIIFLKEKFKFQVGFSDHSEGYILSLAAVALGAKVIEKHFTLDKNLEGPDHKISLQPNEMEEMIKNIRLIENSLGKKTKNITEDELKIRRFALKGIYAASEIEKGEIIKLEKLKFLRPVIKTPALLINKILNKKSKRKIRESEPV